MFGSPYAKTACLIFQKVVGTRDTLAVSNLGEDARCHLRFFREEDGEVVEAGQDFTIGQYGIRDFEILNEFVGTAELNCVGSSRIFGERTHGIYVEQEGETLKIGESSREAVECSSD